VDALRQISFGIGKAVHLAARRAEVGVRQTDQFVQPRVTGEGEALLEVHASTVVAIDEHGRADRVVGRDQRLLVADARGQRDGPAAPANRLGAVAIQHAQVRLDPIGARQRVAARQGFQDFDRAPARVFGLRVVPGADQRDREPRQPLALPLGVADLAVEIHRLAPGPDRLVDLIHDRGLVGVGVQQPGPLRRRHLRAKLSARLYWAAASRCAPTAAARAAAAGAWASTAGASAAPSPW
jgi:hypothetical protein